MIGKISLFVLFISIYILFLAIDISQNLEIKELQRKVKYLDDGVKDYYLYQGRGYKSKQEYLGENK